MTVTPRITPFLWFDSNAEEAVEFYLSIFPNSRKLGEMRTPDDSVRPRGSVLVIDFELAGQRLTALNGGPAHPFTDAVSLVVHCASQAEIDFYWERLTRGGAAVACGWLRDKFGLSWQVVPAQLPELLSRPEAFQALLRMQKLDIAALERAGRE